jgi:GNAT superfamily N-acetyltransferase
VSNESSKDILGFYSLSVGGVEFQNFPPKEQKKIGKYPVPIARIGRLAVDKTMNKKGLGTSMLMDAFYRVTGAAKGIAISHIVVDAKPGAIKFYEKFGFQRFEAQSNALFINMKTVRVSISEGLK